MKRLFAPLIASTIIASILLGSASIAGASTIPCPRPLNASTMSRSYMDNAMLNYTHMNSADFANARATGWSCWSIAASSGVTPSSVVKTAAGRAQTVVTGRVRADWMSRSAATSFMRAFRADCWKYLGTAQTPSMPSVTATCTWTPSVTPTPTVPPVPNPGSGWNSGMCW